MHIGEPISRIGLDSRMRRRAFSRLSCREKSHGRPSSASVTVRSSASPKLRCLKPPLLTSAVMCGVGYISDTILLNARDFSLEKLLLLLPVKFITPNCSSIVKEISSSSSGTRLPR